MTLEEPDPRGHLGVTSGTRECASSGLFLKVGLLRRLIIPQESDKRRRATRATKNTLSGPRHSTEDSQNRCALLDA